MLPEKQHVLLLLWAVLFSALVLPVTGNTGETRIAYLVSDLRIPFWRILARGIESRTQSLGYKLQVHSADNSAKQELKNLVASLKHKVDGIILSPTNSSAAVTLLKLAKQADIPVVIADIGTESGEYVSYIASDNFQGSYDLGRILAGALKQRGWQNGSIGIIAIPQKRANGKARTAGFLQALSEAAISGGDIRQQSDFSYKETYDYSLELLNARQDLRALWLQGSDRYQAALDAIRDAGRQGQVLLICFDAEPAFLDMIPAGRLTGAGMQQPFLMGEQAVEALHAHLNGETVDKERLLPVLAISKENIDAEMARIRRNVLGLEAE